MPAQVRRTRASRFLLTAVVVSAGLMSAACKDDSTSPKPMVAAADAVLPANTTVVTAVSGTAFNFTGGAGAIATEVAGQNLRLTFGGTSTAPTAAMVITTSAGATTGTVTTNVTFGSCIFAVTASTFPTGSRLAVGQVITVNPCNINVNTAGQQANGVSASRSVALQLGSAVSSGASVTVQVNPGGQLVLNGQTVGTVTLTPVTP